MTSNLKPKAECEGNKEKCSNKSCPLFGTLGREGRDGKRRVAGCGDPVARGKRNRAKGDAKARRARQTLGIAGANTRHEEHWGGAFRVEVKAGKQIAPIWTHVKTEIASAPLSQHQMSRLIHAVEIMPPAQRATRLVAVSAAHMTTMSKTFFRDSRFIIPPVLI